MKADDANVTGLFGQQIVQYCVPHYQRPQAWNVDKHWEPLWADIEGKANDWLSGITPKQHYLGAIVLAKRPKVGIRGIDRCLVIDGQQRLSTLQYLLKALSLVSSEIGYADGCLSIQGELYNVNTMMDDPAVQRHKLWPTFRDREAHTLVMAAENAAELKRSFLDSFTLAGTLYKNKNHPRPLESTWFFYRKIHGWIADLEGTQDKMRGLEAARKAITTSLQLIILWLEEADDPQVIFECLNGRGEPLRSTDLIKNFIFMSADASAKETGIHLSEESPLFAKWSELDKPEWMQEVTRGRLKKARLEWLVYYCLQAETGQDLDISRTYETYQKWAAPKNGPAIAADDQVATLLLYAKHLQAFIAESSALPIGELGKISRSLDVTTVTAVALAIAKHCDTAAQVSMYHSLASYLVRREACGLTKKAYNVVFLGLLKDLRNKGFTHDVLKEYLGSLNGDASLWPDDARFAHAISSRAMYGGGAALSTCRLLLSTAAARIGAAQASEAQWAPDWALLHVEHLMPQSWYEYWPLADGTHASSEEEAAALLASPDDQTEEGRRQLRIRRRAKLINTLGNLTVLNKAINMEIKNFAWPVKQEAIREATQLRMNFDLVSEPAWNEETIVARGQALAELLKNVWAGPPAKNSVTKDPSTAVTA